MNCSQRSQVYSTSASATFFWINNSNLWTPSRIPVTIFSLANFTSNSAIVICCSHFGLVGFICCTHPTQNSGNFHALVHLFFFSVICFFAASNHFLFALGDTFLGCCRFFFFELFVFLSSRVHRLPLSIFVFFFSLVSSVLWLRHSKLRPRRSPCVH